LFEEAGVVLKNAVFTGIPIIIISFLVIDVYFPANLSLYLFLFISIVLAFLLKMNINFLAGMSAFWIRGSEGVTHFKDFLMQICSGAILPLSFYPRFIEQFFMYLPFKFIVYVPIQVFQGKYSYTELQQLMLVAVLWVIVLTLLNVNLLNKGIRRVTIFGG
jgi:ABC-2 type transport system permease protein